MSVPYKKWRDELVLFLDDAFDCDDTYNCLIAAGYRVERFTTHFPGDADGIREQSVPDEQVIQLCNRHCWIMVTADNDIIKMHRKLIEASHHLGILATAHNNKEKDISVWAQALVRMKPSLERHSFKKRLRPWFSQFNRNGGITKTICPVVRKD